jgi:hypothetical protein
LFFKLELKELNSYYKSLVGVAYSEDLKKKSEDQYTLLESLAVKNLGFEVCHIRKAPEYILSSTENYPRKSEMQLSQSCLAERSANCPPKNSSSAK